MKKTYVQSLEYETQEEHLRKIFAELPGDDDSRAAALARIKGVGEEIKPYLGHGAYRSEGDKISLVGRLMEEKEETALALREHSSLETVLSRLVTFARHAAYGVWPAKEQERIAEFNNEDARKYSSSNYFVEQMASVGLIYYGLLSGNGYITLAGTISGLLQMGRIVISANFTDSKMGSPFFTIPYHLVRAPYFAVKSISRFFKELDDEIKEYELGKALKSKAEELHQLPSPKEEFQISIDNNELTVTDSNGDNMLEKALAEKAKQ